MFSIAEISQTLQIRLVVDMTSVLRLEGKDVLNENDDFIIVDVKCGTKNLNEIIRRYNAHEVLVAELESVLPHLRKLQECYQRLGACQLEKEYLQEKINKLDDALRFTVYNKL